MAVKATPKGKGLRYTYSEGDFKSCQDVLAAPVKASGITPAFGTEAIKQKEDHFGIVFKGLLKIDKEGEYVLSVCTDDGSKGWMDGELLWDMDRDGGGFKDIFLKLDAGYHRLEVQYFENYGGDDVEVGLYGPGVEESRIPASMLCQFFFRAGTTGRMLRWSSIRTVSRYRPENSATIPSALWGSIWPIPAPRCWTEDCMWPARWI